MTTVPLSRLIRPPYKHPRPSKREQQTENGCHGDVGCQCADQSEFAAYVQGRWKETLTRRTVSFSLADSGFNFTDDHCVITIMQ